MNSRVFIAASFLLLVFSFVYTQNYSQDVILNIYGAGVYTGTNRAIPKDDGEEGKTEKSKKEEKTEKATKNVLPNYNSYSSDSLLQALSGYFETSLIYSKSKNIFVRGAIAGEVSYIITADGRRIPAVTKLGDVVAREEKKKGDEYIIDGNIFKYEYSRIKNYNNIWSEYIPRPSIRAIVVDKNVLIELNSLDNKGFYFDKDDVGRVLIKEGDYLFIGLGADTLYSMDKLTFNKTYKVYKKK